MTQPEFQQFSKIPRLKGGMVVTEKIDGTNAQLYIPEEGTEPMMVGSRKRWIFPGKSTDNFGFAAWALEHEVELREGLGPGRHFGEWWGQGIQRRYGLEERRFSLFNVNRWQEGRDTPPDCCSVVPILYQGPFSMDAIDTCMKTLQEEGSVAAPGFMSPEGIVVFLAQAKQLFKRTFDGDKSKGQ